jgi:hypothetical protein
MKLRFPPLSGGVIQGLNDAGIETFEGDYAHFVVRESAQNSLDAAASPDHPVRLEFAVHSLPTEDLPFLPDLRDTLQECQTFWRDQAKPREFFERASRIARQEKIYALRVSDFGTTGVPGGDLEMNKPWFGLVRSRGVSIKADEASAGAFGIGKDAPLAASAFRTVIYSTRTRLNEVAVQGTKNRSDWWATKLARNKQRDQLVTRTLRNAAWHIIRVWECDLSTKRQHYPIKRIRTALLRRTT